MVAEKGNKVYQIDESMKNHYLNEGFDIRNDEGEVIAYGKGKTVSYEQYKAVLDELEQLKNSLKDTNKDEFSEMSVEELKVYAQEHGIDIGNASSQAGIAKKIRESLKAEE